MFGAVRIVDKPVGNLFGDFHDCGRLCTSLLRRTSLFCCFLVWRPENEPARVSVEVAAATGEVGSFGTRPYSEGGEASIRGRERFGVPGGGCRTARSPAMEPPPPGARGPLRRPEGEGNGRGSIGRGRRGRGRCPFRGATASAKPAAVGDGPAARRTARRAACRFQRRGLRVPPTGLPQRRRATARRRAGTGYRLRPGTGRGPGAAIFGSSRRGHAKAAGRASGTSRRRRQVPAGRSRPARSGSKRTGRIFGSGRVGGSARYRSPAVRPGRQGAGHQ